MSVILSQAASAANVNEKKENPLFRFLALLGKRVSSEDTDDYSNIRQKFLKAGIRKRNVVHVFWGAKILLAVVFIGSFFLFRISLLKMFNPSEVLSMTIFLGLIGFYLPEIWLYIKTSERKNQLLRGLPDALDLLVVCVEAGMGLDAAINRVAEEIKLDSPVLSDELRVLNLEMRAGKLRQDALKDMAMRMDLEDIKSLVTLLIQTDKFGTSMAQALRVYSDSFRTKRFQRAEEIAAKLPVKLIFPCILFIFPSLFVVILGPAAIRIYEALIKH
jgi:tight adherence protein C